jgi:dolichol-phosphate mannosyltransferase
VRVLVVLPTYQEASNIENVLRKVRKSLPDATVLVVDDSSPDHTGEIAEKLGQEIRGVEVLSRPARAGLGSAYRAGFAWGLERSYEAFIEMDADLSHDPEALPDLLTPLENGFEVVVGSRYVPGGSIPYWSWHRRLLSRAGNVYASALLHLSVTDLTSGFRAYAGSVLRNIDLDHVRADGYGFQIEMVYRAVRAGAAVTEVPIRFVDRVKGESKMSMHTIVEALGLVTWWGLKRLWSGPARVLERGQERSQQVASPNTSAPNPKSRPERSGR